MKEILIKDEQKYLEENYPFEEVPLLTDFKHCIHCDKDIIVADIFGLAGRLRQLADGALFFLFTETISS